MSQKPKLFIALACASLLSLQAKAQETELRFKMNVKAPESMVAQTPSEPEFSVTFVGTEATGDNLINNDEANFLSLLSEAPTMDPILTRHGWGAIATRVEFAYNFSEPYSGRVLVHFDLLFPNTYHSPNWSVLGGSQVQMRCGTSSLDGSELSVVGNVLVTHMRTATSMIPTVTVPTEVVFDEVVENCTGLHFMLTDGVSYVRDIQKELYMKSIQLQDLP
jgi:hypothetical protein